MNKTYSTPKVVRTWVLLFSVPLYIGGAALWMKEEIKLVLGEKDTNHLLVTEQPKPKEAPTPKSTIFALPAQVSFMYAAVK
ncbi:hypothetical protein [Rufibacter sp. LB8]|uniref:hypothetical protein n=1 Tax=Rufibacter sp. LB8 TaxID=2777781 RepID=UPI00178C1761|nr:hypothetical protein [Rufibacter sp. LB8]